MNLFDSLRVLRRRWFIVLLAVVAGAAAGWLTAPGESGPPVHQATHSLIVNPGAATPYNIEQAALLATSGPIPERVGQRLGLTRGQVTSSVSALADKLVLTVRVTGRSTDPRQAEALADVTAAELVTELSAFGLDTYRSELDRLTSVAEAARGRVADAQKLAEGFTGAEGKITDEVVAAELNAAQGDLRSALQALGSFRNKGEPEPPLKTLDKSSAHPVGVGGVSAPDSKPARAGLLGAFGLLLGIGAALVLDRLDTRLHTRRMAEDAFGYPVIAEIPPFGKAADAELLAVTRPSSPMVEAYRGLRTIVALWSPDGGVDDGHRVIVVTSPSAGEGKTTSVAHLAAMLAEIGRTVMVVSTDFRRPRLHLYFGRAQEPGLTDILRDGSPVALGDLDLTTDVRGVQLIASGAPIENPAPLIDRAVGIVRAARGLVDFVLVDSPPLLVANDAIALAQAADGVLLMARAGRTSIDAAQRSAEMLERVDLPVVGVVLTAAEGTPSSYRYYRNNYYAETPTKRRFVPWRRKATAVHGNGHAVNAATPAAEDRSAHR